MSGTESSSPPLRQPAGAEQIGDLSLHSLPTEDTIINTLRARYQNDNIYSTIHDSALVFLNPYKDLHNSSDEISHEYVADYKDITSTRDQHLPPHVFQLVNNAYMHMRRTGEDQTIMIVGEFASGKTEVAKLAIQHLMALSTHQKEARIAQKVLATQFVLEAFGNAKTSNNLSASRFGKYVELQFNERGRITGAKTLNYTFDKRRVSNVRPAEQNFNVFYYMLAGLSNEERSNLRVVNLGQFNYLSRSTRYAHDSDAAGFQELISALRNIGFNSSVREDIFQLLAGILHLGNLDFVDDPKRRQEATSVRNRDELELTADLFGVDPITLEGALIYRSQLVRRDIMTTYLDSQQAAKQRDELANALYSLLFSWVVEYINKKLCNDNFTSFIGIVDMPGFRSDTENSFEQFLINFANEKILNMIFKNIFETRSAEYQQEEVNQPGNFGFPQTNSSCIDLFTRPETGLIAIMEAQSSQQANRNGDALLEAFDRLNGRHPSLSTRRTEAGARLISIQHSAGEVVYEPDCFIERNADTLSADFVTLFQGGPESRGSSNAFMVGLFAEQAISTMAHPRNENTIVAAQQPVRPRRAPSMRQPKQQQQPGGRRSTLSRPPAIDEKAGLESPKNEVTFAASQIQSALEELNETINQTFMWTIFCLCPNDMAMANNFDKKNITRQVSALSLAEITRALAIDYTYSIPHQDFLERYTVMLNSLGVQQDINPKSKCEAAVSIFPWTSADAAVGRTKIFLGETAWRGLEDRLRSLEKEESHPIKEPEPGSPASEVFKRQPSQDRLSTYTYGSNVDLIGNAAASAGVSTPPFRAMAFRSFADDSRSLISDDEYTRHDYFPRYNDVESVYESEYDAPVFSSKDVEMKKIVPGEKVAKVVPDEEDVIKTSSGRRWWVGFTWFLTWWIPSFLLMKIGRMKRADVMLAWREKVALCILIVFLSAFVLFFILFFGVLVCPRQNVYSLGEISDHQDPKQAYVAIRGEVFDMTGIAHTHYPAGLIPDSALFSYAGIDASLLFPIQVSALCNGISGTVDQRVRMNYQLNLTDPNAAYHDFRYGNVDYRPDWYWENMQILRQNRRLGFVGYTPSDMQKQAYSDTTFLGYTGRRQWASINGMVYDFTFYINGGHTAPSGVDSNFMHQSIVQLFSQNAGGDVTQKFNALPLSNDILNRQLICMRNIFFVGKIDNRNSAQCVFSEYILLVMSGLLCSVVLFKFIAALQLGHRPEPEDNDKFVICQVPCYTEGEESLRKTIDSIAMLKYDDRRKLMFIICDGMIVGGGNDRPTPSIVLDILGVNTDYDPEPKAFFSLGEGSKQENYAKIYSGLYNHGGHSVPYVVVVKVGKSTERQRPGNRGKRDSQMILMRFLNKVHFDSPMSPMELELFHHIKNVIGVHPSFYEFVLMVDADTEVVPDSLNFLISTMVHDSKIIGLCGETTLANQQESWVTMIQVYEYYISHHLAKAFESLFGSVTCLPGCFCMYRIRTTETMKPLLVSNQIINDYSENRVDTLHKKNLLHLGEDRYLTTLILRHFSNYKTKFNPDAMCKTNAPETWSVLVSQRRRWINSTIHNLGELVRLSGNLCGFLCFSMRFVVLLDLLSTIAMPATTIYLFYLLYLAIANPSQIPKISIILLAATYALQAIIFIIRRKWEHVGWMVIYILAIPVFSFWLPLYSFWRQDDFSWGNTRVVVGEKGQKKVVSADEGKFNPDSIPLRTWDDYEQELLYRVEAQSRNSQGARSRSRSPRPKDTDQTRTLATPSMLDSYYGRESSRISPRVSPRASPRASPRVSPRNSPRISPHDSPQDSLPLGVLMLDQPIEGMPSDDEIMNQVQRIINAADLMTITKKQIRDELSNIFGIDMSPRKDFINDCIEFTLKQRE